jgi:hypothetical protein
MEYITQSLSKMLETQYFLLNIKGKLRAGFTFLQLPETYFGPLINSVLVTTQNKIAKSSPKSTKNVQKNRTVVQPTIIQSTFYLFH